MTEVKSREFRLAAFPEGLPNESTFDLVDVTVPSPGPGEVVVQTFGKGSQAKLSTLEFGRRGPDPPARHRPNRPRVGRPGSGVRTTRSSGDRRTVAKEDRERDRGDHLPRSRAELRHADPPSPSCRERNANL